MTCRWLVGAVGGLTAVPLRAECGRRVDVGGVSLKDLVFSCVSVLVEATY